MFPHFNKKGQKSFTFSALYHDLFVIAAVLTHIGMNFKAAFMTRISAGAAVL